MHTLDELLELGKADEGKQRLRVMLAELEGRSVLPESNPLGASINDACLPRYCSDLNATAEVENSRAIRSDPDRYVTHLLEMCGTEWGFATALQRTIALILTLQEP